MGNAESILYQIREGLADLFTLAADQAQSDFTFRLTVTFLVAGCCFVVLAKFVRPTLEKRLVMAGFGVGGGAAARAVDLAARFISNATVLFLAASFGQWAVVYRFSLPGTGAAIGDVMSLIAIVFAVV